MLADILTPQHIETFCIRRHHPVLDPVMYHFDEVPCAVSATVKVSFPQFALAALRFGVRTRYVVAFVTMKSFIEHLDRAQPNFAHHTLASFRRSKLPELVNGLAFE
jgi:hypothetical protein